MALTIKKTVDLSSLGKEYEGIELVFRSIPAVDLGDIDKTQSDIPKDDKGNPELSKVLPLFIEILEKYFLEGKQGEEKVAKEDIKSLDSQSLIYCFQILTGQDDDPKDLGSSTNPSTTEPKNPSNS